MRSGCPFHFSLNLVLYMHQTWGCMTYFICSRSDTAGHFFELTKEVNGQGRLANILSIGQANPLLASFGMPDIYHDMSRDHLDGDFFEEAIPFECLAISDYVFSLKSAIAVECMWAGLNVIGFGSLEDRKQVPCYAFSNVARYANSLFAFRKILEEGSWRVNRQRINEVFGYREDWEDRLAAILYNVRLALTAQPMALHA